LEQAWNPAWLVSRLLQAETQALRTAAQLIARPSSGLETMAVAKRTTQAAARRSVRMVPRSGAVDWPIGQ